MRCMVVALECIGRVIFVTSLLLTRQSSVSAFQCSSISTIGKGYSCSDHQQYVIGVDSNVEREFGLLEDYSAFLQLSPLVGGPDFLALHSSIVLENDHLSVRVDFLPDNATDPSVLSKLISLQSVPGIVRFNTKHGYSERSDKIYCYRFPLNISNRIISPSTIKEFCENYQANRGNLSLITNNCFHFCYQAYFDLLTK